jgi:tetratricopeptide (TPR) repeat protein
MRRIYDTFRLLWNNSGMKLAAFVAAFGVSILPAAGARAADDRAEPRGQRPASSTAASPDKVADAYAQFLLGHRFEENEDETSAIAAYKRAMELDPNSAEIPAQLAGLYLKQSKVQEAMTAAEAALKIAPANREANRVLGTVYAALSESGQDPAARGGGGDKADANLARAIQHF